MKRKNGFTFVELLGAIAIMAVLLAIVAPEVSDMIYENKQKLYQKQNDYILMGLKTWASDNMDTLEGQLVDNDDACYITLGDLQDGGYVEEHIKNPINNNEFASNLKLIITKKGKSYNYSLESSNTNLSCIS